MPVELGLGHDQTIFGPESKPDVTVPALPGVVNQGETVEQCIERVEEAIALHLAAMAEDGEPIPEEHEKPLLVTVREPSR